MKLSRYIKEASANLFTSKLRSILGLLGILVGTASVVAMVSGGEMATNEALKQFKTLGTDLFAVSIIDLPDEGKQGNAHENMTLTQAMNVKSVDSNIIDSAAYSQVFSALKFNGRDISGGILGVSEGFARLVHVELAKGRFVSWLDGYTLFCVIGSKVYEQLKKISYVDPIGQQIQIGNNTATIIGVAKSWPENNFVYVNVDYQVIIPIQSSLLLNHYASINNIIMRLSPDADIASTQANITKYINQCVANKRLNFRSAKELVARMAKQSQIMTIFLGLIGSVSLLVGGIGVMNIMLVSVLERKREIGVRLAVGATRLNIQLLFLAEAVMLSLVGGTLGVVLGLFIAYLIAAFSHWQTILFIAPPLIGFSVSVLTGVFFGFYPAYKAAQLDPIQALRAD